MTVISSYGVEIIKQKIEKKDEEIKEVTEELRTQRETNSSTDDNPEISMLMNRHEKLLTEKTELGEQLRKSRIVDVTKVPTDRVSFGSVVDLLDIDSDTKVTYRVLSPVESDLTKGFISYESPLGSALIGCRVEDSVDITIRNSVKEYEVLDIRCEPL